MYSVSNTSTLKEMLHTLGEAQHTKMGGYEHIFNTKTL